ncbi:MAG: site-2 protease family protein [Gammaproteobacteria bacterium]|nr:MAG: site-2 protease family protein [Gammaproteobacteria bacterium]
MDELTTLQKIAVWALPVIFGVTVHEAAHGWVANKRGDSTARLLGRLTLNPLRHIDLIGTLLLPALMMIMTNFIFGWAKPVPVNEANLKQPKRDMALVALAGPTANLLMAVLWAMVMAAGKASAGVVPYVALPMIYMGSAGVLINGILMLLNLLPIPPLDGSRVLMWLLPDSLSNMLRQLEPYGFAILILLLVTGVLGQILLPALNLFLEFFGVH